MNKWGKAALGFGAFVLISQLVRLVAREGATPPQPNECGSALFSSSLGEELVRKGLRDPDSAVFGDVNAYDDRKWRGKPVTAICGSVNAKNGFGGYSGQTDFVLVPETGTVNFDSTVNNGKFVRAWNALCAGRHRQPCGGDNEP